ncbi:hypothetical protein LTR17_004041 [Elasticomyces elasticus]|nr:hypothetical protein LTR17_004041 [Elasticomyces elasticus]
MPVEQIAKAPEEHDVYYESENAVISHAPQPVYTNDPDATANRHQMRSPNASARQGDIDGLATLPSSADDYLACFWNFTHPVFPVLHKPTFVTQYNRLWNTDATDPSSDSDYDERTFLAILNTVFALRSRSSSTIPAEESDERRLSSGTDHEGY